MDKLAKLTDFVLIEEVSPKAIDLDGGNADVLSGSICGWNCPFSEGGFCGIRC